LPEHKEFVYSESSLQVFPYPGGTPPALFWYHCYQQNGNNSSLIKPVRRSAQELTLDPSMTVTTREGSVSEVETPPVLYMLLGMNLQLVWRASPWRTID
jgi:hypothetical protein